jgi:hypothetical protein
MHHLLYRWRMPGQARLVLGAMAHLSPMPKLRPHQITIEQQRFTGLREDVIPTLVRLGYLENHEYDEHRLTPAGRAYVEGHVTRDEVLARLEALRDCAEWGRLLALTVGWALLASLVYALIEFRDRAIFIDSWPAVIAQLVFVLGLWRVKLPGRFVARHFWVSTVFEHGLFAFGCYVVFYAAMLMAYPDVQRAGEELGTFVRVFANAPALFLLLPPLILLAAGDHTTPVEAPPAGLHAGRLPASPGRHIRRVHR